jgi:hypothetical protein
MYTKSFNPIVDARCGVYRSSMRRMGRGDADGSIYEKGGDGSVCGEILNVARLAFGDV